MRKELEANANKQIRIILKNGFRYCGKITRFLEGNKAIMLFDTKLDNNVYVCIDEISSFEILTPIPNYQKRRWGQ